MTKDEHNQHHYYSKGTYKAVDHGVLGFASFLAYIGAVIYFIEQSGGAFWPVILAFLQAMVWPVYVVYHVLRLLGA